MSQLVNSIEREQRADCCACGTSIPVTDLILEKFQRCYYCGKHNPFGTNWKSLLTPIVVITVMTALTVWWSRTPL